MTVILMNYVKKSPKGIQMLVQRYCNGAIVFNNNIEGAEQDEQVRQQLKLILINIKENGGEFYTNGMYTEAEKKIRKEEGEKLLFEKEAFEENPNFLKKNMTKNHNN